MEKGRHLCEREECEGESKLEKRKAGVDASEGG